MTVLPPAVAFHLVSSPVFDQTVLKTQFLDRANELHSAPFQVNP